MDKIAQFNQARWAALARNQAIFTRPRLDMDAVAARELVDPEDRFGDLRDLRVLCLASGGGQQSVAFALLGAQVTVVDLSAEQLARDREAADHYQLAVETVQADMRDLSMLPSGAFDLVFHPYSINFVPDARVVFREVAQRLKPGGRYFFMCANPCFAGLMLRDWDGNGYALRHPYVDGAEIRYQDEAWVFRGETPSEPIDGPVEYKQTWGRLINGLIDNGFVIERVSEEHLGTPDLTAEPGTTDHFTAIAPPWLKFWARYQPVTTTMP